VTPFESTDGFHRFRVELGPAQSTQFVVPEVVFGVTQMELAELERDQLLMFSGKETPREVREKLEDIIKLQEQIATMQGDLKTAQAGIDTLFRDQERLRENLKALRDTSEDQQLRARYLEQLKKQEDRIDASRGHIGSVTQERVAAQARLGDLISNLTFGN
jgi:DNA repair exonuclease SbcCD ATPase subunit